MPAETTFTMPPKEQEQIRELNRMLRLGPPALVGPGDEPERVELPEEIYSILKDVVRNMANGRAIMLVPQKQRVTTQAAADLLGCSRPHLVKLLESGAIPFERVGQHRRVMLQDLLEYQKNRDRERRKALNELAKAEYAEGSYEGIPIPQGGSDE